MSTDLLNLANNLPFVDEVYAKYVKDPASVDASWRNLFESSGAIAALGLTPVTPAIQIEKQTNGNGNGHHAAVQAQAGEAALQKLLPFTAPESTAGLAPSEARYGRTFGLVNAHRARGHMVAKLDPLEQLQTDVQPELDPRAYGFSDADLDAVMPSGGFYGTGQVPLRELMRRLRATYCEYIDIKMNHITNINKHT